MKFALIGAELPSQDVHSNYERTGQLRNELVLKGLAFVGVSNNSANIKSQLFLVECTDENEIISLAREFGQKAVLISDEHKNMEAVSVKSNGRISLGKFEAVTQTVAKESKFYISFNEDGKDYYYVTTPKKGAANDVRKTNPNVQVSN